jgi:hypothetical protein
VLTSPDRLARIHHMIKHQETHPNLDVDGCFGCKIAGISISSAAMPGRKADSHRINETEKQWHKDMDAYKRLRRDGLQPKKIDGSHMVEAKAKESYQVETGLV